MEWHPFTISSAPEMEDVLWLHIRAVGEWTKRVYEVFAKKSLEYRTKLDNENFTVLLDGKNGPFFLRNKQKTTLIPPTPSELDENSNGISEDFNSSLTNFTHNRSITKRVSTVSASSRLLERALSVPVDIALFKNRLKANGIRKFRPSSDVIIFPEPENEKVVKKSLPKDSETTNSNKKKKPDKTVIEMTSFSPLPKFFSYKTEEDEHYIKSKNPLFLRMNGPYGSPSSDIFNTEHAVLIATGIGVTPFASILESIMFRYIKEHQTCPKCAFSWSNPIPPSVMKLKKVDFVWINRNQKCFEWFVNLLSQIELTQAELAEKERFLEIHIYITSALAPTDIKAVSLHMALDLMHSKEERDLITGLKTRTKAGRPNWDLVS